MSFSRGAPLLVEVGDHPIQYRIWPLHPWRSAGLRRHSRPRRRITTALVSWSNPAPGALTSLTTSRSTPLRSSLRRPRSSTSCVSAAKPDQDLAGPAAGGQPGQDVGRRLEDQLGDAVLLGQLVAGRTLRPEVGHGGGHDDDVGALRRRRHGSLHVGRRLDVDPRHAAGHVGRQRRAATTVTSVTAAPRRRRGHRDGVALLARRAVRDEAHRVEGLTGAAGAHHHP